MKKKILFVIFDGLGDRAIKKFGNQTPLEAAHTPNLDKLAKEGICGLAKPSVRKKYISSKDGHLAFFGYDVKRYSTGRGVFEALGAGFKLEQNDVALRGNLATVDESLTIIDRRAGRIDEKYTSILLKALQGIKIEGVKFLFQGSSDQRTAVILRGKGISEKVSDGDKHKTNIKAPKIKPLEQSKEAKFTAKILNDFLAQSHQILKNHPLNKKRIKQGKFPANYILMREPGVLQKMPSFKSLWQMKPACVAGGGLYKGLGIALGMEMINVQGANGEPNTNLKLKMQKAMAALFTHDFVFLHIKGTDIFSHDGDCVGKKNFLEKADKLIPILFGLKNTLLVFTADHSTPCELKEHSRDPVPFLIFGDGQDKTEKFSEKECAKGKLGKFPSKNFIKIAKKLR